MNTTLYIASDHAGYELKQSLISSIKSQFPNINVIDLGPPNDSRVDYPDFADNVAHKVAQGKGIGLLICGSGQGMAMRANKYPNVRASVCWNNESCQLSRQHNDANILCLGARLLSLKECETLISVFLNTAFEGQRHVQRVKKISLPLLSD